MTTRQHRNGRVDVRRIIGVRDRATANARRPARRNRHQKKRSRRPAKPVRLGRWLAAGLLAIAIGGGIGLWSMDRRQPPQFRAEAPQPVAVAPAPQPEFAAAAPADPDPPADILDLLPAAGRPLDAEDEPAWRRNAVAIADTAGRPLIAVVIDDLGLAQANADRVVRLPGPLTLAFMTYAPDVAAQAAAARAAGHELLVHVPMQPVDDRLTPGHFVLQPGLPVGELEQRIDWALSRFDGYVGVNNHMGSRFTADAPAMAVLFQELKGRGLLFLDSRTTAATVADALAARYAVPFARRDVFLDNEQSAASVWTQLAEVEARARRTGAAVAIGHPHDATIAALAQWLPTLQERGFALVPISRIVEQRQAQVRVEQRAESSALPF